MKTGNKAPVFYVKCPEYRFENPDLAAVSAYIDAVLLEHFQGKQVVMRGIQSGKHQLPKDELIKYIQHTGTDRYETSNTNEVDVTDVLIDLFGYGCTVEKAPIVLPVLEGFHKWKPKSLERPQLPVDIWMVYDANQLENVEYTHKLYNVKANDGYRFKNTATAPLSLLGIINI